MHRFSMTLGAAAIFSLAAGVVAAKKPVEANRPNIVIILVDDMGFSDLGCYGSEIRTPNLDALAAGGIRFTQFYNTAKCWTTRAALMTGLYSQQCTQAKILTDRCVTIAEVLVRSGYRTLMSGKWHLNGLQLDNPAFQPPARGFEKFFGTILGAGSFYHPYTLQRGTEQIEAGKDFYYTDAVTDDAVANIRAVAGKGKPFFQYVAYTAPHWPMHALPEDIARYKNTYRGGWDEIRAARLRRQIELGIVDPKWTPSPRDTKVKPWHDDPVKDWQRHRMAVYAAMVDRMDQGVGRIVQELKARGVFDSTVVFFLSDNGGSPEDIGFNNGLFTLGGKQTTPAGKKIQIGRDPSVLPGPPETYQGVGREWANVSNTPFRMFKTWSHEGGIATPLIAHWPRGIGRAGTIVQDVGHLIDLMPTCLALAGAAYPETFEGKPIPPAEGKNLLPVLTRKDPGAKPLGERTLFWEFANHAAVRQGKWKLVAPSTRDRNWQLYDMEADRCELNDLASAMPEKTRSLATLWEAWARRTRTLANAKPAKKPETKSKVKPKPS